MGNHIISWNTSHLLDQVWSHKIVLTSSIGDDHHLNLVVAWQCRASQSWWLRPKRRETDVRTGKIPLQKQSLQTPIWAVNENKPTLIKFLIKFTLKDLSTENNLTLIRPEGSPAEFLPLHQNPWTFGAEISWVFSLMSPAHFNTKFVMVQVLGDKISSHVNQNM